MRGPSIGRMAATPIAILIAGIAFALLLGPAYLWIGGALVVAIAYLLAANGQRR